MESQEQIILIVEDEADAKHLIRLLLEREGFTVYEASDGYEALNLLEEVMPHLIICDILMPNMDGFEFRNHIVSDPDLELVPFIFLTALSGKKDIMKGFQLEVDDYIVKPFDNDDLISRIKAKINKFALYRTLITVDVLTGLYNRRFLINQFKKELERVKRYNRRVSCIMIDIDNFKSVNDTYGHITGDMVLRGFAEALQRNLRDSDFVGRYGGEEFVLVVPETNKELCLKAGNRIKKKISEISYTHQNITLTISGGIASAPEDGLDVKTLLYRADQALYAAKKTGKNIFVLFDNSLD